MAYENHHLRIRNSLTPLNQRFYSLRDQFEALERGKTIDIEQLKRSKDDFQAVLNGMIADCLLAQQALEENQ